LEISLKKEIQQKNFIILSKISWTSTWWTFKRKTIWAIITTFKT